MIYAAYFVLKGALLFALYLVITLNGGIDPLSHQPSTVDPNTVLALAFVCWFVCAPAFAALQAPDPQKVVPKG